TVAVAVFPFCLRRKGNGERRMMALMWAFKEVVKGKRAHAFRFAVIGSSVAQTLCGHVVRTQDIIIPPRGTFAYSRCKACLFALDPKSVVERRLALQEANRARQKARDEYVEQLRRQAAERELDDVKARLNHARKFLDRLQNCEVS